jgi:AraC family transcriptional regulator of adaptative response/methylated-DNA-[protein]-cysteine methyltransferase
MKTHYPKANTIARTAERILKIRDLIAEEPARKYTLKALASMAAMSPFHFQRSFKRVVGVTPKDFIEAERLRTLKSGLRGASSVTDAIYRAGFGSSSRVYERVDTRLGMTPGQYRSGGAGIQISYGSAETALGCVLIGATDRGICFVQFGNSAASLLTALKNEYPRASLTPMLDSQRQPFDEWMRLLAQRIEGAQTGADLPLDIQGTQFQLKVWKALLRIPPGAVASYGEVARQIGQPRAVRAVASACATNRIAVFIPCHRVIRGDGSLGGYRWGLARKRALLDRERGARS